MALQYGRGGYASTGEESTWGTPVTRTREVQLASSSLARTYTRPKVPHLYGRRNPRDVFTQSEDVGGDIVFMAIYANRVLSMLLKHAFGQVATTGSGPYTHTFTLAAALPTGLTVEVGTATDAEVYAGCKVARLALSVAPGGLLSCAASLIGKTSGGKVAPTTPTLPASPAYVSHAEAGAFTWNSLTFKVRSFGFTLDNRLARRDNLGSAQTDEPVITDDVEVAWDLAIEVEDDDAYAAFLADDRSDAAVTFTGPSSQSLTFNLQNARIDAHSDPVNAAGLRVATIRLIGLDDGTDMGASVVLVNSNSAAV